MLSTKFGRNGIGLKLCYCSDQNRFRQIRDNGIHLRCFADPESLARMSFFCCCRKQQKVNSEEEDGGKDEQREGNRGEVKLLDRAGQEAHELFRDDDKTRWEMCAV